MYITGIGQAVLELSSFEVGLGNLLTSEISGDVRKYEVHFIENDVTSGKSQLLNIEILNIF